MNKAIFVMRLRILLLALVLIICGLGFGATAIVQSLWGPGRHARAAEEALERYDFVAAEESAARWVEARPNSWEARLLAARVARRAVYPVLPGGADGPGACLTAGVVRYGDAYDAVEEHLAKCAALGGPVEVIGLEMTLLRAQRGELQLALAYRDGPASVEKVLRTWLDEGHPDAMLIREALVKAYVREYRLPDALKVLNAWLAEAPDVQALLWRAWVAARLGDDPEAFADYRRALELAPDHDRLRLRVAELTLQAQNGGPAEAVGHFETLRKKGSVLPAVLLGLAQCRKGLGETDEAQRLLGELAAAAPDFVPGLIERGKQALEARQEEQAETLFRAAVARDPFNPLVNYHLYLCLIQRGKKDEARAVADRRARIENDLTRIEELSRRVMARPRDAGLRADIGTILLRNGLKEDARRWLFSALREDPACKLAHAALADYCEQTGQAQAAAEHRRRAQN